MMAVAWVQYLRVCRCGPCQWRCGATTRPIHQDDVQISSIGDGESSGAGALRPMRASPMNVPMAFSESSFGWERSTTGTGTTQGQPAKIMVSPLACALSAPTPCLHGIQSKLTFLRSEADVRPPSPHPWLRKPAKRILVQPLRGKSTVFKF